MSWALGGGGGGSTESKKLIGGKGGSVSYRRDTVDIQLKNVPYIQQNIETAPGSGIYEARSDMYCGLASAMMVRAMGRDWPSEFSRALDYWHVGDVAYNNNELRAWDNLLLTNARLVYSQNLDVTYNGLLHTGRHYDDQNYEDTKNLLQHIYTLNDFSGYAIRNQDNVVACDMRPVEADEFLQRHANVLECDNLDIAQNGLLYVGSKLDYFEETKNLLYRLYTRNNFISTYPWYNIRNQDNVYDCTLRVEKSTDVMDIIWNHIKETKKPVITIIDSSKIGESENSWKSLGLRPVLHYNVIYGISETHRERTFHIYDPILNDPDGTSYTESEYRWMLALPHNTPFWLYSYTAYRRWFKITDPCYIMTIH